MKVVLYNWHDFRKAALWLIHGQWALNPELSAMAPESRPVKNFDHGARIIIFFWTLQNRWQRWQKKYLRALTEGVMPDLLPKVPSIITLNNYNKEPWTLFFESFFEVIVLWIQGNSCDRIHHISPRPNRTKFFSWSLSKDTCCRSPVDLCLLRVI
jgi:hypothetical protein